MQQNQTTHSPKWYAARKRFFICLIAWLAALPAVIIAQFILRFLLSSSGSDGEAISTIGNVISLLAGIYGLLGWIPTIIFAVKWGNTK